MKRQLAADLRAEAERQSGKLATDLLHVAWKLDTCGGQPMPGAEAVQVRQSVTTDKRSVGSMLHCSKNLCPACSKFNWQRRREAVLALVAANLTVGRHFHVVITLRHRMGVKWKELAGCFRAVWRKMQQSVAWKGRKAGVRVEAIPKPVLGFVRADELTFGESGFHHHIHLLLTLRPDVDVDEFREWFQRFWARHAEKLGRTADWSKQHGWWSEIEPQKLRDALLYQSKNADLGDEEQRELGDVLAGEVMGASGKGESAPWELPALEFLEVWNDSKGHRWFATGGVWRTKATMAVEADEDANAQREDDGEVIAEVAAWKWKELDGEKRAWLLGMVFNEQVSRADFIRWWWGFWRAFDQLHPNLRPPDDGHRPLPEAA